MAKVTIDLSKIDRAATEAFKETCFLMGAKFTESISDPKWGWPVAPSPRDVVDTGRLRAAQQLDFLDDSNAQYSWNVFYAIFVLLGWTARNGKSYPGRDWIRDGLDRLDVQKTFELLLKSKL